jgi:hypothetical protein
MIVSREWIEKNKTASGAWTRPQIRALGIDWPPTRGWINRVENKVISDENARIFELREPSSVAKGKSRAMKFAAYRAASRLPVRQK